MLLMALSARATAAVARDATGGLKEWLLDRKQEEAAKNVSYDEPAFQADNAPILLISVQHGEQDEGGHLLNLIGRDGQEHGLGFDDESLFGIIELLRIQTTKAEWNLDFSWPTTQQPAPDSLHLQ